MNFNNLDLQSKMNSKGDCKPIKRNKLNLDDVYKTVLEEINTLYTQKDIGY